MNPPDEQKANLEHAIHLAELAMAQKRFQLAQHHLAEAQKIPGSHAEVQRLEKALTVLEAERTKRANGSGCLGFFAAAAGYLLLAVQSPSGWGFPVWAVLLLLVVPLIVGTLVGRLQGPDSPQRKRFRTAFRVVGWAMFFYAGIALFLAAGRVQSVSRTQRLPVLLFVLFVYCLFAGIVSGLAGSRLAWRTLKETPHEPAS